MDLLYKFQNHEVEAGITELYNKLLLALIGTLETCNYEGGAIKSCAHAQLQACRHQLLVSGVAPELTNFIIDHLHNTLAEHFHFDTLILSHELH